MFNAEQIKELSAKLDKSHVKQREQAGRKLSYIEGWHAIAEANRIFGYDAWTRETLDIRMVAEGPRKVGKPPNQRDGFGVSYIAKVRVIVDGVAREGIGAGHGIDTDLGLAHESAIKEAETDAMKRALMTFGNPFGLALYDKTQENVETHSSSAPAPGRNAPAAVNRTSSAGATLSVTDRMIAAVGVLATAEEVFKWWNLPAVQEAFNALSEAGQMAVGAAKDRRLAEIEGPFQEAAE
jgi:DNA repair and recombination protein RAD52